MIRKIILAAMLAISFASTATPAIADELVRGAPPPPRVEETPAPRAGYVWVAGHWDWRYYRYQWVKGTWMRERSGYHYAQPTWSERGGRWYMERGGWRPGDPVIEVVPSLPERGPQDSHND